MTIDAPRTSSKLSWKELDFRSALRDASVTSTYSIAFSVRSGSTWLCEMLAQVGLGKPTEYFQYPYEENANFHGISENDDIGRLISILRRNSVNGIFASKMTHDHRARLEETLRRDLGDFGSIGSAFPNHKWIYLRRRQVVAQAVSLFIAQSSGNWHATQASSSKIEYSKISYDFLRILSNLMELAASHVNWECYFSTRRIEVLEVFYEDLVESPHSTLNAIFGHLQLEGCDVDYGRIATSDKSISGLVPKIYEETEARFTDDFLRIGQSDDTAHFGPPYTRWVRFFRERSWLRDS